MLDVVGQVLGVEHLAAALGVGRQRELLQVLAHEICLLVLAGGGDEALREAGARLVGVDDEVVLDGAWGSDLLEGILLLIEYRNLSNKKSCSCQRFLDSIPYSRFGIVKLNCDPSPRLQSLVHLSKCGRH